MSVKFYPLPFSVTLWCADIALQSVKPPKKKKKKKKGPEGMLPKLLQILNAEDLRCVQFLRGGRVRVSFREEADRDHFFSEGMRLDDEDIPVTRDAEKVTVLYIRDLPYEVASDDVIDFFSTFGEVLTVERSAAAETPNLCNANRVLKMVLKEDLPYFISVCGYQCRVWYRGQPIQCFVCRQLGHRAQSCPLSGRCRYCHQVGHMARNCAQAWDPTPPVVSADVRTGVDELSVSDSDTIIADEPSVVPDSDPIPMTAEPSDELPLKDKSSADPVVKVSDKSLVDCVKVADKSSADSVVKVSGKSPADSVKVADKSPDVPMPASSTPRASKSFRPPVTAKMFCARFSKTFQPLEFPDFGDISDKERDSKAKAHLRARIRTVFNSKQMDILSSDLRKWSESDLREISNLFCKMLSVRDYLVDFVSGVLKSYWNTAKSKSET